MKEEPKNHFILNPHTHYILQFKDKDCTWIHEWTNGGVKYYSSLEAATRDMEEIFRTGMDEASVIEWKKEIKVFKKKQEPVIESKTTFDVEVYDRTENNRGWRGDEYGFETLKEAQRYIKSHTMNPLYSESYRIVRRDTTVKTSVV